MVINLADNDAVYASYRSLENGNRSILQDDFQKQSSGAHIRIQSVSHWFAQPQRRGDEAALHVIDGLSLDIAPGEFVALIGPSGCGKSSLLRLVAGLEPPTQGAIAQGDAAITAPHPSRIVVFQDPTLFPWRTVWQNVALGLQARGVLRQEGARVDLALAAVGLSAFSQAYPHQLSGGMAQRVALARALVNEPSLLVLDEPLGKLDSLTRLQMQGELLRLWQDKGFSTLLVTHDVEEALFLAQRVVVLSERPARIKQVLVNDLPYPRQRTHPRFIALRQQALALLGLHGD
jgi:NitT/TauT family transport system ATP-binding protein